MRVFVPRDDPGDGFVKALGSAGHEVSHAALTAILDLPRAKPAIEESLGGLDWLVVTSANAVQRLGWLWPELPRGVQVAVIGPATAAALPEGVRAALVGGGSAAALMRELSPLVRGARILVPGSAISDPNLARGLRQAGASVSVVPLYSTRPVAKAPQVLIEQWDRLDAVALLASSQAKALVGFAPDTRPRLVALGTPTARACVALGWPASAVAAYPTPEGVVAAIERIGPPERTPDR